MTNLIMKDEVYRIQGAIYEVYREIGSGFAEAVYQEALERELTLAAVPHVAQQRLTIHYKGIPLRQEYIADLVCYGKIIVELKALSALNDQHMAQVLNYLSATRYELGLLVNFGAPIKAECRRVVMTSKVAPDADPP